MKFRGPEERKRAGEKLEQLLKENGLTAASLARIMKEQTQWQLPINPINPACIDKFIKGECHEPSTSFVYTILESLDVIKARSKTGISPASEEMEAQIRDVLLPSALPQRMLLLDEKLVTTSESAVKVCQSVYNGDCAACREKSDCPIYKNPARIPRSLLRG